MCLSGRLVFQHPEKGRRHFCTHRIAWDEFQMYDEVSCSAGFLVPKITEFNLTIFPFSPKLLVMVVLHVHHPPCHCQLLLLANLKCVSGQLLQITCTFHHCWPFSRESCWNLCHTFQGSHWFHFMRYPDFYRESISKVRHKCYWSVHMFNPHYEHLCPQ